MDFFVSATSSTVHLLLISTVEFCKIPFCPWLVALLTLPFFFCFAYYRAIQILRLYIYNNFWLNPTPTLLCQGVLRGHNRGLLASNGQKCYQIKFEPFKIRFLGFVSTPANSDKSRAIRRIFVGWLKLVKLKVLKNHKKCVIHSMKLLRIFTILQSWQNRVPHPPYLNINVKSVCTIFGWLKKIIYFHLMSAEVKKKGWVKVTLFDSTKDCANTVWKSK